MAGDVVNMNICSPLILRSGLLAGLREAPFGRLTGNHHATEQSELMSHLRIICHYSYNLPLSVKL